MGVINHKLVPLSVARLEQTLREILPSSSTPHFNCPEPLERSQLKWEFWWRVWKLWVEKRFAESETRGGLWESFYQIQKLGINLYEVSTICVLCCDELEYNWSSLFNVFPVLDPHLHCRVGEISPACCQAIKINLKLTPGFKRHLRICNIPSTFTTSSTWRLCSGSLHFNEPDFGFLIVVTERIRILFLYFLETKIQLESDMSSRSWKLECWLIIGRETHEEWCTVLYSYIVLFV